MRLHQELLHIYLVPRPRCALFQDLGRRQPQACMSQGASREIHYAPWPLSSVWLAATTIKHHAVSRGFPASYGSRHATKQATLRKPSENGLGKRQDRRESQVHRFFYLVSIPTTKFPLSWKIIFCISLAATQTDILRPKKKQHLLIHFVKERDKSYTNGIRKSRAFPETSRIKVCTRKQCYSSTKSFVIVCRPGDIFFRHSWSYLPSLFTPIILPQ